VPKGLQRRHGGGERHFITCSCNHRQPFLGSPAQRDLFLKILEEVRRKYDFVVWGYVVMPEHFHLLISEPVIDTVARAMQVLKQRVSRDATREGRFCGKIQARFGRGGAGLQACGKADRETGFSR
jgi:putative transposase